MNRIMLSVDLEDWFHPNDFNIPKEHYERYESRILVNTERLLELFERNSVKATFFVLGCVCEKEPELIRRIAAQGHEIACHSFYHELLGNTEREILRSEIRRAKDMIEDTIGLPVKGFRAPSWSIGHGNLWVLELLQELGFQWDSSLQPFRTPLSGISGIPDVPFRVAVGCGTPGLLELPPTVHRIGGLPIPYAGGLYMRLMPLRFLMVMLEKDLEHHSPMLYCHPWEYDEGMPVLKRGVFTGITHYHKIKGNQKKLEQVLDSFSFQTIGEAVAQLLTMEETHGKRLETVRFSC